VWTQRPSGGGLLGGRQPSRAGRLPRELSQVGSRPQLQELRACARQPLGLREFLGPTTQPGRGRSGPTRCQPPRSNASPARHPGPGTEAADRVRERSVSQPKLTAILRDMAGPASRRGRCYEKARGMLRELQAMPDPATLRGLEELAIPSLDRLTRRRCRCRGDWSGFARCRAGSVVFMPSTRATSNTCLLSYVLRKDALSIPVVAAGDNLAFFPVGPVFRRAGAFSYAAASRGDRLYTAVVSRTCDGSLRDDGPSSSSSRAAARARQAPPAMLGLAQPWSWTRAGGRRQCRSPLVPVSIGYGA
jgi:glycerol-3-phosphate O-acyltransferase